MEVFEVKNKQYCKQQLTKLGGNRVLRSRPSTAMFVVSFANSESSTLSHDPLGDPVMSNALKCTLEGRLLTEILLF